MLPLVFKKVLIEGRHRVGFYFILCVEQSEDNSRQLLSNKMWDADTEAQLLGFVTSIKTVCWPRSVSVFKTSTGLFCVST